MARLTRHGRLALVLAVGIVGVVGATMLVAIGAPAPGPDATVGQVTAGQGGNAIAPQSDDGIQVAQTVDPTGNPDKDKGKGKCPSKPCPKKLRPSIAN